MVKVSPHNIWVMFLVIGRKALSFVFLAEFPDGLHFSAVLSDFSIYVFHPYGGKQSTSGAFPLDTSGSFTGSPGASDSPFGKSGSGRRDSLSVNLEFVKVLIFFPISVVTW